MWKDKLFYTIATRGAMFKILKNCTFTPFKEVYMFLVPSKFLYFLFVF